MCKLNIVIKSDFKLGVIVIKDYKESEINFTVKVISDSSKKSKSLRRKKAIRTGKSFNALSRTGLTKVSIAL
ncbi:hypothetical protein AB6D11_25475 [Vibrio splendidus]